MCTYINAYQILITTFAGLFSESHMDYDIERPADQPSLTEMTESAIKVLRKSPKGFFLLVEGWCWYITEMLGLHGLRNYVDVDYATLHKVSMWSIDIIDDS